MTAIKRDKPVILTGSAASTFLATKKTNEQKAKQFVSSIHEKQKKR